MLRAFMFAAVTTLTIVAFLAVVFTMNHPKTPPMEELEHARAEFANPTMQISRSAPVVPKDVEHWCHDALDLMFYEITLKTGTTEGRDYFIQHDCNKIVEIKNYPEWPNFNTEVDRLRY